MTAARSISPDAKCTGCFLLVTFLLRQKKSNIHKLKVTNQPIRSNNARQFTNNPRVNSDVTNYLLRKSSSKSSRQLSSSRELAEGVLLHEINLLIAQ